MEERQKKLLFIIVSEYIETAIPVGSEKLLEKYQLDVSPATVRNDMIKLEGEGYLVKPHTSAGRVPTEKAYHLCIRELAQHQNLSPKECQKLKEIGEKINEFEISPFEKIRLLAKSLAEVSGEAVVVGVDPRNIYYTGLSNLFNQPEFSELELIIKIGQLFDNFDEIALDIFNSIEDDYLILIGSENPFDNKLGIIASRSIIDEDEVVFGILGPMRMDYQRNLSLLKTLTNINKF